ncbi:MAG TPA: GDSL-type esterase/lipase family protein [Polyangiaceae bacterium]|nr:GDSL-type esterase/lipase family protein [Polyangiaceae bacterium]
MAWLPSWATSIQLTEERNAPTESLATRTLRQFVFPTYSGTQIRIQLSNEKGTGPVEISKVHIAKAQPLGSGQIDASTDAEFTFSGSASVTIPQGETVWSDPLEFSLEEMQPTAVTMLLGATVPGNDGITGHPGARTNSYVATGDVVSEASISGSKYERWYFINAIEVMAPAEAFAIVALGDSITDGYGIHDEFKRWPDYLTAAINADPDLKDLVSVIDAGNGGNALLNGDGYMDAGVDRVARDVLARPKVKHVIVLFGVNDILYGTFPSSGAQGMADNIIGGYQDIVEACRAAGVKVYGSPITPFGANNSDLQMNSARTLVNTAVLAGDIFDDVIDFSAVLVQPGSNPEAIQASMDNDGLHPSAAGYEAMGNAVDLALFK